MGLESPTLALAHKTAVLETACLLEVVTCLDQNNLRALKVVSAAGEVVGLVDRGDVSCAVAQKLALPLTEDQIQLAKQEGAYPQDLPLGAIARTLAP
jgi:hypothetical protein